MCGVFYCIYWLYKQTLIGFVDNLGKLKEKGIEKVIFMVINDAFVMDEWNKLYGDKQIDASLIYRRVYYKNE